MDLDFSMLCADTLPDFAMTNAITLDDSQNDEIVSDDHEDGRQLHAGGLAAANAAAGMMTPTGMATPTHTPVSCACCLHKSREEAEAKDFGHVGPLATHK